jgi:hypothetical protein
VDVASGCQVLAGPAPTATSASAAADGDAPHTMVAVAPQATRVLVEVV